MHCLFQTKVLYFHGNETNATGNKLHVYKETFERTNEETCKFSSVISVIIS